MKQQLIRKADICMHPRHRMSCKIGPFKCSLRFLDTVMMLQRNLHLQVKKTIIKPQQAGNGCQLHWHDSQELLQQNMNPSSKSPHMAVLGDQQKLRTHFGNAFECKAKALIASHSL